MKTTNPLAFLARWSVTFFLMDRAYGGPEEGGWWYTAGEPILPGNPDNSMLENWLAGSRRVFFTWRAAHNYANTLRETHEPEANRGRPSMYSVLSEGVYRVRVSRGEPVRFPETPPHYE